MKWWTIVLLGALAGCAQAPQAPPAQALAPLLSDASFAPPSEPVTAANLFALSEEMRRHLRSPVFSARMRERGAEHGLVDALYEKGDLKLEYDSSITRNAAQTYAARSGNCLSLVIMTAAFAKELGMKVRFQSVDVEDSWSRNGGLYLVSSHVNLSLGQRPTDLARGADAERMLTIDFLPPEDATKFRTRELTEDDIVVMYMNNRAAEALVQDRVDDAYWWAREAVRHPSATMLAYNTLGVIYQRRGNLEHAERVFRAALEREPKNLVVMQNLVPVLKANGKTAEADALAAQVAKLDPDPPFHFFDQGMQALNTGDYRRARALFEREVRRAPYNDEFHFWLAIALLRTGEPDKAREQLKLALTTSTRSDSRNLYEAKLAHLRKLGVERAMN